MKRSEAVAHIRLVERRCRGPHVAMVAEAVALLAAAIDRDRAAKASFLANPENDPDELPDPLYGEDHDAPWFDEAFEKTLLECPTTKGVATRLLEGGHDAAASFVDTVARGDGCGADINALIVAGPFNGEPASAACPKCKTVIRFTPAIYEIDADDPERVDGDPIPAPVVAEPAE